MPRTGFPRRSRFRARAFLDRYARGTPVTWSILGASVLGFLATFFVGDRFPVAEVAFVASRALRSPWTFVTYPIVSGEQPFFLLLTLYWAWVVGSELEQGLGRLRFLGLFVGSTVASAVGLFAYGGLFPRESVVLVGLWLPLSGLTIVWCLRNPGRVVLFSFLVPVSGAILGALTAILVYLSFGPVRGLFALGGCLYGFLFVRWRSLVRRRPAAFSSGIGERTGRLGLFERLRLMRARRRLKKVWDSEDPDRFVN